ncbi:MAG: hypothetical protein H6538_00410 [Bacteroidales bacterium]|nr:hypothetical protein [Bacteroidales bacterium]MCB9012504.1 hypothetical protein [Bacteroidales bacterium]
MNSLSMLQKLKIKFLFLTLLILFTSLHCKRDRFTFPYVTIYANIGIVSDLGDLPAGNVKIFPRERFGGVGGLIVYRDYDDNYMVFDAACTFDYENDCFVASDPSFKELMVCPCCSSSYLLSSGGEVFKSPAKYPLVQYQSFIDGNILRVVN